MVYIFFHYFFLLMGCVSLFLRARTREDTERAPLERLKEVRRVELPMRGSGLREIFFQMKKAGV